ncbi:hypothetical protein B0I35DRAFT_492840 [Stachybotrys elegans]|uniref:Rhodopsin domain-containing protein n=1 Tax=Stachybotrys elegans TaxID=80388 RepID=A0A8K0WKH3_9HYPO|nr:hypothetical protein B0I35DRAFT_492840 [Stachybotrys elegans]
MEISTSIAIQAFMIGLALCVTLLRIWVRLRIEQRALTLPDYFVWAAWIFASGWFICSILALNIGVEHPLDEIGITDSTEYLKVVFVSAYCFDIGLYLPKISIVIFYWWLIPSGFRRLRVALYICTGILGSCFLATLLADTLITQPISDNWSLENQLNSMWNSYPLFILNWVLNIFTDLMLFCLPFFILNCLKLHRRQKIGLAGVFSLGMITILVSAARFTTYIVTDYNLDDASGNAWCTIEICTAIIVVSLPGLKSLIMRSSTLQSTGNRNTNGYIQTYSGQGSRISANTKEYPVDGKNAVIITRNVDVVHCNSHV